MKLLILGSTGRTGKLAFEYALKEGHTVNCLSRNSERIKSREGLSVFEGDPTKKGDLQRAMEGCEAVVSVLNVSRKSDFPWAPLRTPEDFLSQTMEQLIPIAEVNGAKRLVVCSAWGVSETKDDLPSWFRWFIDHSNIGVAYADHERQERLIEGSKLGWTIVRPVGLTNSKGNQKIRETLDNQPKPGLLISRKSVAQYLVDSLQRTSLVGKKVVISKE